MTKTEFEVERDAIELAYEEKIMQQDNALREIATRNADLKMQKAQNEREQHRISALRDAIAYERNQEILKLEREYLATKED